MIEDIDLGRLFELATTNRIYVNGLNLPEKKSEILIDYTGYIEMIGKIVVEEIEPKKTNIRFENIANYEVYKKAYGLDYDSEDVILTGWLYKLNTPDFNRAKKAQYD